MYNLFNGKEGIVNWVAITDRRFRDSAKALAGNGRGWVDALVGKTGLPPMGKEIEIKDMQTLRVGDIVQLEGHRAFVAGREIDSKGVLTSVLPFDANVPAKGQDFRTQSAIHENRSVPIKYAVRLYDLASRSVFGAVVEDVTPTSAKSLRLTKPEGVLVEQVIPKSPAEDVGILA
jgi:hypothetical protein